MEPSLPAPLNFSLGSPSRGVSPLTPFSDAGITPISSIGSLQAIVAAEPVLTQSLALSAPLSTPAVVPGKGLLGQYYSGINFDTLILTRVDPTINFSWGLGSPDALLGVDRFSTRWTGKVQAKYSETYTFYTNSDDAVRLWLNGQLVIDNWLPHGLTQDSATITLVEGQQYDIKLDYYEDTGSASSGLSWSSASQKKENVPQSQLYEPDLTLPTSNLLTPANKITSGGTSYQFSVVYADNTGITQATIDNQDILVSGPNQFSQLAKLVNVSSDKDGSPLTAIYRIDAPGAGWNTESSGTYSITLQANQVSDGENNFISSNTLGTFLVDFVPPTAQLVATNPVVSGSTRYSFSVVYSDNLGVYLYTIDSQDLQVSGPNNFSQLAQLDSISPSKDGRSVTAIYSINAPNKVWDTTSSGIYTVVLRANQISDTNRNTNPLTTLGIIKVDLTPPTATLSPLTSVTSGSTGYEFTVVYSDNTAVKRSTIDSQDILVTGPTSSTQLATTQLATLVSINSAQEGSPLTATYRILAPGGTWDSADTGLYQISLQANQITDLNGNFMAASVLGTLAVDLTPPTANLTALNISIEGQRTSSFTIVYSDNTAVKRSTIDRQEVLVTGPNNAAQLATLVSVSSDQDSSPLTATYSITAPGGTWDIADIGAYSITLQANSVSDRNSISDSSGNFITASQLGTFWADLSTYAGDFDGDGKVDVLSRDLNSRKVSVSLVNGTLPNSQVPLPDMPANYSIVDITDFNGDGKADLLWRDSVNQKVVMWLMDGNTLKSQAFLPDISASYSIADTADFDGDGNADLLWRDSINQKVIIWLINGTTVTNQLFLRGYG
jgi:PA14 domain/FG-GAP-like repeat